MILKEIEDTIEDILSTGINNLEQPINEGVIIGCGSSYNAALFGRCCFESIAKTTVNVEHSSEYQYRNVFPHSHNSWLIAVTQSGETHDTIEAIVTHKPSYSKTFAITNEPLSTVGQMCNDLTMKLCENPERSVAATKTFTMSCLRLLELACSCHSKYRGQFTAIVDGWETQYLFEKAFDMKSRMKDLAYKYSHCKNFLFLGRQYNYAIAREAALKLKEVSYIHAEGLPAAEMKHGPIALVDENTPSLFIITDQELSQGSIISNLLQIASRGGPVIVICDEQSKGGISKLNVNIDMIIIPSFNIVDNPIKIAIHSLLANFVLQIFAFHMAMALGVNPDRPRNLAKTIVV